MRDTFKVGDRVRWVDDEGAGDVGTVIRVGADHVWVLVDSTGSEWLWPLAHVVKMAAATTSGTITIDSFTLTLDQARRAGEAAAQVGAEKKAAAEGRVVVVTTPAGTAIRVPSALIRKALNDTSTATHLHLWDDGSVSAGSILIGDTLLLDTPELFERLRGRRSGDCDTLDSSFYARAEGAGGRSGGRHE